MLRLGRAAVRRDAAGDRAPIRTETRAGAEYQSPRVSRGGGTGARFRREAPDPGDRCVLGGISPPAQGVPRLSACDLRERRNRSELAPLAVGGRHEAHDSLRGDALRAPDRGAGRAGSRRGDRQRAGLRSRYRGSPGSDECRSADGRGRRASADAHLSVAPYRERAPHGAAGRSDRERVSQRLPVRPFELRAAQPDHRRTERRDAGDRVGGEGRIADYGRNGRRIRADGHGRARADRRRPVAGNEPADPQPESSDGLLGAGYSRLPRLGAGSGDEAGGGRLVRRFGAGASGRAGRSAEVDRRGNAPFGRGARAAERTGAGPAQRTVDGAGTGRHSPGGCRRFVYQDSRSC